MKKYFSFYGRAKRPQYWCITLLIIVATILAVAATRIVGSLIFVSDTTMGLLTTTTIVNKPVFIVLLLLWLGFGVTTTWLWFAVTARRLRDAGWTPWLTLVHLLLPVNFLTKLFIYVSPVLTVLDILLLAPPIAWIVFGCLPSKK